MKKIFLFGFLMLSLCWTAFAKDLKQGDECSVSMELEFKGNPDDFISWELVGDDWDLFDYRFSQGSVNNKVYTIKAGEYKDFADGKEGITLFIKGKPKTVAGSYSLTMKVKNVSKGLGFSKSDLNLSLPINYTTPPPPSLLERLLVPGIILLALIALLILVLHLASKFPGGMLQLGREEVYLKGKKTVSVKDELLKANILLGNDVDVIFVKKKFGSFQGPCIKDIQNCSLERDGVYLSKGTVILPDEDIHGLTDINGNEILIRYC